MSSDSEDHSSSESSGEGFFSTVGNFFDSLTKARSSKKGAVADYLNDVLVEDAQAKFVRGFRFRPPEELLFPFSCNLVSRNELVECVGFISFNFVCFLGQFDSVDDRGHKVTLRVIIPLRSVERILPICVVKGIYEAGEKVDAFMLNTATARHQVVWVDDFDVVLPKLRGAWDKAQSASRADDPLPVSLVLNPEFASMSASSAETSPRGKLSVLRVAAASEEDESDSDSEGGGRMRAPTGNSNHKSFFNHNNSNNAANNEDDGDAVSDEYDSEHIESLASIERVAVRPSPERKDELGRSSNAISASPGLAVAASATVNVAAATDGEPSTASAATAAVSPPRAWSDVKI